jgi:uncharacterized protein (DUF4415 family)
MKKKGRIVSYTAKEIDDMIARGEDMTDWARAEAMTQEEIEAAIASDPDEAGMVIDWSTAMKGIPEPKKVLNMRIDGDVLKFFREFGRGYQTKINAVLRSYMEQTNDKHSHDDGRH